MTPTQPLRIVRLEAENILRLAAVEITANGESLVIGGENESGKSSLLAAIEMAFGGKGKIPAEPIRRGASKAQIVVDLGDMVVTRRFSPKGTELVVTNKENGAKYPSPQSLLDGLVGKLSFDPLAFATMDVDEQAATLRALARIDISDLDEKAKVAYDERTLVNRDVKQSEGALAKLPAHADVGLEPRDFQALSKELTRAEELARADADAERALASAVTSVRLAESNVTGAGARVEELRRLLEAAEAEVERAEMMLATAHDDEAAKRAARQATKAAVPDTTAIRAQLGEIETFNRKVAENRRREELKQAIAAKKAEADTLTSTINSCECEKADRLAAATFPLPGLGLAPDGSVTWNGLPFAQASTAIRTRVSVAIGAALNPTLRVCLVRGGNDLGDTNLQLLAEAAEQAGMQCLIERIAGAGKSGLATVVIEDGRVIERREPAHA